ncbi:asparagine synthetase B [Zoogloea sp.]|uniref:asparagine synthetase B family protein n=1 Tax=Zoogloea sp. TaxID=49181 RepID=UPI0035B2B488
MNTSPSYGAYTVPICAGHPRFSGELATLAQTQGPAAAWAAAFAQHGTAAPRQVTGDYAVAICGPEGETFLAIDRFAIRTLCYRQGPKGLGFAERANELADGDSPVDPQAIFDYLFFHAIPSPRTIFKGILRLPPAHYAHFKGGKLSVAPYWVPTFQEPRSGDFGALKGEFMGILENAVKSRLEGYAPEQIGCFLSGGTDSSTVAGMITQVSGRPAASYSIGFDAQGYDEMEYARIAARRFGTDHHEYYVTPADLVRKIPDVATHYDQPFGNSSALPAFYCARMAHDDGVRRMLAGDGGDELFGGNTRYAKQRVFGIYDHVPSVLRKGFLEPVLGLPGMDRIPIVKKGVSYIEQARVPMPERTEMYNLLIRLGADQVLTPAFLARVDQRAPHALQKEVWNAAQASTQINRMLAFDWRFTLAENDLPKVVGTTRLAEVDVAFPLLDDALLDFSCTLPPEFKLKGFKLRWFFKEALRGFLPDEIITKKKHGFGLPFGVWACKDAALRQLAGDTLNALVRRNILDEKFLRSLTTELLPAYPGYYGELVWILMMLEQWLQKYAPDFRV